MSNSAGIGSHDPPPFSFAFSTGGGGVYSGNVNSGSLGDDTTLLHTDVFENHFENHFQAMLPSNPTTQLDNPAAIPGSMNTHPIGGHPTFNSVVPHRLPVNLGIASPQPQQQVGPTLGLPAGELQSARQLAYTQPAQRGRASRPKILSCLIPGCNRKFSRSDSLGNHLRKQHDIPIPRGRCATIWMSKAANHHHYLAALEAQLRANNIVSPVTEEEEGEMGEGNSLF